MADDAILSILNDFDLNAIDDLSFLPVEEQATPKATKPSAYRRQVIRQKEELAFLRTTIRIKQEELQELQAKREREEATVATNRWQQLAKDERKRQYEAMMENRRLRAAINEQLEFAEALADLIRKKPRLCVFPTDPKDQWKELKLVADPTARYAAFHAIVDREYAKIESAFIDAKLVDATNIPPCHEPYLNNDTLEVHTKLVFQFPPSPNAERDFAILTESIWDILRGGVAVTKLEGFRELLVEVDDNVAYTTTTRRHSLGAVQRRVIYKRYTESIPHVRFCIVGRSVEEDELQPLSSDLDICKETTWCTVEALDNDAFLLKYYHNFQPFRSREGLEPRLISQYLMDIHASFLVGFDAIVSETCRRSINISPPINTASTSPFSFNC